MIRRRVSFPCAVAALAAASVALPSASASAASSKVLLITRGEEGEGPPAVQGEAAHMTEYVRWTALGAACGGADEHSTVGKNPNATVKVTGSDVSIGAQCFTESGFEPVPGGITIKSVSVAKTGAVKLSGVFSITAGACSYRATKLTGTQVFGQEEEFAETLTGTGKLAAHSANSCAKTTPVEDFIGVANAAGYNYVVQLTS